MKTLKEYKKEMEEKMPVGQNFHTGLYGYERYMGCLDLSECVYRTERSAKIARAKAIKEDYEEKIAMDFFN